MNTVSVWNLKVDPPRLTQDAVKLPKSVNMSAFQLWKNFLLFSTMPDKNAAKIEVLIKIDVSNLKKVVDVIAVDKQDIHQSVQARGIIVVESFLLYARHLNGLDCSQYRSAVL
jgi:hypothetical protein